MIYIKVIKKTSPISFWKIYVNSFLLPFCFLYIYLSWIWLAVKNKQLIVKRSDITNINVEILINDTILSCKLYSDTKQNSLLFK